MDLQDATLDDVEAVVVAKLLEGVGFVSVHLETRLPQLVGIRGPSDRRLRW
jgi:hypothetical protein